MNLKLKSSIFYLLLAILFISMKLGHKYADISDLYFLLKPTDILVSLFSHSNSVYSPESGFFHNTINVVIDKSCSGSNFFILSFSLFVFTLLPILKTWKTKLILFPLAFLGTYIFTILVNSSRIVIAILLNDLFGDKYPWLHEAEGLFVYLSFLTIAYLGSQYLINKTNLNHEKLA